MKTEYAIEGGCLQRDSVEHEKYVGAYSTDSRESREIDDANLLEKVLERETLNRAYKRVKVNKGAAGVDVMKVEEEPELLKEHKRAKAKLKKLTSRSQGRNVRTVMQNVKTFMQGWLNYYSIADMQRTMENWNGWLRRRIRMYIWKQWKNPRTRVTNLGKLGMPHWKAYRNDNSRKG